jgi:hypothetical protein
MIPWSVKTRKNIHHGGIKIKKIPCIHISFSTYQNQKIQKTYISGKHPAKILPTQKYF